MNAFFWKKAVFLRHEWKKGLFLILLPAGLAAVFCLVHIEPARAALYAAVAAVLLSNIIFWDLDDILNYETTAVQPVSRLSVMCHYFFIPGVILYAVDICLAVLTAAFFSVPVRFQWPDVGSLILGGLFSAAAFTANNAQILNYQKFTQYTSLPFGIGGILLPVLIYLYPAFFEANFTVILLAGTACAAVLLVTLLLLRSNEKSLTEISRIVAGYGEMND